MSLRRLNALVSVGSWLSALACAAACARVQAPPHPRPYALPDRPRPALDPYSVLSVRWDFPSTILVNQTHVHPEFANTAIQFWYGQFRSKQWLATTPYRYLARKPGDRAYYAALARTHATVSIDVFPSAPTDSDWLARRAPHVQLTTLDGSFSGKRIGEECRHTPYAVENAPGNRRVTHLYQSLQVRRGPVVFHVDGSDDERSDWSGNIERCAMALVERIDAAIALTASRKGFAPLGRTQLAARFPNGITVVHVNEFAAETGAKAAFDFRGSTATIKAYGHTLLLHVGRKEAWMDGKAMTLPFPALRDGGDRLWCPLSVLEKLSGGNPKVAGSAICRRGNRCGI